MIDFLFNIGGNWEGVFKVVIAKRLYQQMRSQRKQFEMGGEISSYACHKFLRFPGLVSKYDISSYKPVARSLGKSEVLPNAMHSTSSVLCCLENTRTPLSSLCKQLPIHIWPRRMQKQLVRCREGRQMIVQSKESICQSLQW